MPSSRVLALQIISAVLIHGQSLNQALTENLNDHPERSFIQEICYGVIRWYLQLIAIVQTLLYKPLKTNDKDIEILLLIGLYQLIYMKLPQHAAVNETVKVTRELKKSWASKLVNGTLRQFLREQETIIKKIEQVPSAQHAHPEWLLKILQIAWPDYWEKIITANNQRPPMTLRVNALQTTRSEYLAKLTTKKIAATTLDLLSNSILLTTPCDVGKLPGFNAGKVSVQDAAAQLAAMLLELESEQNILDACAAPGGKTAHILETQPKLKQLVILDKDKIRLKKINDNLQRLQLSALTNLKIQAADAVQPETWWDNTLFDRILLDAPCSATGVIRRHPDIKLLRRAQDITNCAHLQLQLLTALWPLLKPNGILLYATCSVMPAENWEVLQKFLALHANAREKVIEADWGIPMPIGRQILPGENNMDGFYYARIVKKQCN